jgi:PhnB protein
METVKSNLHRSKSATSIPQGFHTITPFLLADDASELIQFLERAFEGGVTYKMTSEDGIVRHATVKIGDSIVMVSNGTEVYQPMPCILHVYVEDADSVYQNALSAGGISIQEPRNEFYGDRTSAIKDRWGNQWWIATHMEDVDEEEMKKREKNFRKEKNLP